MTTTCAWSSSPTRQRCGPPPQRALLALDIAEDERQDLDPLYYREIIDSPPPREFRTVPASIHDVHANLSIANIVRGYFGGPHVRYVLDENPMSL